MSQNYSALVVRKDENGKTSHAFEELPRRTLASKEVEIKVHFSSLNYKDALSFSGHPGVTQKFPHVPGIDASGTVLSSQSDKFKEGDEVIITGYDLGMNTHGGLGEIIVTPEDWIVKKPDGLTLLAAMQLGTAGFTAAQSVTEITNLIPPSTKLPVVVTGATGGVGCIAAALLHHLGYPIHVISRKASVEGSPDAMFLQDLYGLTPTQIHDPSSFLTDETKNKPFLKPTWLSAVDTIGGEMIPYLLKTVDYKGVVTCCGLALGTDFKTTVFPFLLRGLRLVGIDSVQCPYPEREDIWKKLSSTWKIDTLDKLSKTISLKEVPAELEKFVKGAVRGRVVVKH